MDFNWGYEAERGGGSGSRFKRVYSCNRMVTLELHIKQTGIFKYGTSELKLSKQHNTFKWAFSSC